MVTRKDIIYDRSYDCIVLDTDERFWIKKGFSEKNGFSAGLTMESDPFIKKICLLQYPIALNIAVSMLAHRPYSKGEISFRLFRRHFTKDVVDLVLFKLEKEKLLDDLDFCRQWVSFRQKGGYGPSVIRRELKMKGIDEDTIDSVMVSSDQETVYANMLNLARKAWMRYSNCIDEQKKRQKVITYLVRKGFCWDDARSVCCLLKEEE